MLHLDLQAHRVIGEIKSPDGETIKVTRLLTKQEGPKGRWIIAEVTNFDGDISPSDDQEAITELGQRFPDMSDAIDAFNSDHFEPSDYELGSLRAIRL